MFFNKLKKYLPAKLNTKQKRLIKCIKDGAFKDSFLFLEFSLDEESKVVIYEHYNTTTDLERSLSNFILSNIKYFGTKELVLLLDSENKLSDIALESGYLNSVKKEIKKGNPKFYKYYIKIKKENDTKNKT